MVFADRLVKFVDSKKLDPTVWAEQNSKQECTAECIGYLVRQGKDFIRKRMGNELYIFVPNGDFKLSPIINFNLTK